LLYKQVTFPIIFFGGIVVDKMYSTKKRILELREEVENEFLSTNMNEQKLLELSVELDTLILMYVQDKKVNLA